MLKNIFFVLKCCLLFMLFSGIGHVRAQSALDLRINEFLVHNESNYMDDFGQHSPWIEIFNSAYNTVDIGTLYITDDINNPTKYQVAKGQPITVIQPRSYIVLWADDLTTRGILHLNFKLQESKTICLFEANGKTLIDSITIPGNQKADLSYGRVKNGDEQWTFLEKTTPNADNDTNPKMSGADQFVVFDPSGIGLTIISMSVVFFALAFLYLFFKMIGRFMTRKERKIKFPSVVTTRIKEESISGEIAAAISVTLYLYGSQFHDVEDPVVTIAKVSKTYSPWSSKIYGLRKSPR